MLHKTKLYLARHKFLKAQRQQIKYLLHHGDKSTINVVG